MSKIYTVTITHTISVLANNEDQAINITKQNLDLEEVPNSFILQRDEKIKVEEEKNGCKFAVDLKDYLKD